MKLLVVCYHYINDNKNKYLKRGVKVDELKKQLTFLKQNYQVIHFSDLAQIPSEGKFCIITFDDGVQECYTTLFPILECLKVKATLFVCSSIYTEKKILTVQKTHLLSESIGEEKFQREFYSALSQNPNDLREKPGDDCDYSTIYPYDSESVRHFKLDLNYQLPIELVTRVVDELFREKYDVTEQQFVKELYITEDQLKLLQKSELIEIGAHTTKHLMLSRLSVDEQLKQIAGSIDYLESEIGCEMPIPFAYPYGRKGTYSETTKNILVNESRVQWACNMRRAFNTSKADCYDIYRYDVNDVFRKSS